MASAIDLTPLSSAVARLSEGLERYLRDVSDTQINEQGLLLGDWSVWRTYRDMRVKSSNAYDGKVALEVVAGIASFLEEAQFLVQQIGVRLRA